MDPASRATASEAWNLVSMLPYMHSSHSNLVVILSCFKSTLREMQWDLLVIASLWMKLLLFQVYMMLMLFCFWGVFLFTQRDCQSWPAMEWCWLQTGWQGLRGGQGHKVSVAAAASGFFLMYTERDWQPAQPTSFSSSLLWYTFPSLSALLFALLFSSLPLLVFPYNFLCLLLDSTSLSFSDL